MGDLNFPSSVKSWKMVEGLLFPKYAEHKATQAGEGGQVRQQAARQFEMVDRYQLTQQVGVITREQGILDLVWSSDPDLISNIQVDTFPDISLKRPSLYSLDSLLKEKWFGPNSSLVDKESTLEI